MRRGIIVVGVVVVTAVACAPYAIVEPARTRIGRAYSVEPQIRWTSLREAGHSDLWTVDGPALQAIRFIKDVDDGASLLGRAIADGGPGGGQIPEDKQPRFRATMTPTEIVELVVDTWALLGASRIQATGVRPAKFGDADGFRFDLAFVWADGVEGRATGAGAVVKNRLQLILYSGTRLHYFDKHRPAVDRLIESTRLE